MRDSQGIPPVVFLADIRPGTRIAVPITTAYRNIYSWMGAEVIAADPSGVIAIRWDRDHAGGHPFDTLDTNEGDVVYAYDPDLPQSTTAAVFEAVDRDHAAAIQEDATRDAHAKRGAHLTGLDWTLVLSALSERMATLEHIRDDHRRNGRHDAGHAADLHRLELRMARADLAAQLGRR